VYYNQERFVGTKPEPNDPFNVIYLPEDLEAEKVKARKRREDAQAQAEREAAEVEAEREAAEAESVEAEIAYDMDQTEFDD